MERSKPALAVVLLATLGLSACAGIARPEQTGFISDYSKLEQVDNNTLLYSAGKFEQYSSFIVDPVELLIDPAEKELPFSAEELAELQTYLSDRLIRALSEDDGYPIVTQASPGTARIRFGITDVKETIGLLNIALVTKITGAGIGGASVEAEIVDSVTGEQLAAAVRWGGGSRILRAGITRMGDAKLAMNRWAKAIRKMIDEAHEK